MTGLLGSATEPLYSFLEILKPYGWVAVISYLVAVVATPVCRGLARRVGLVDRPDGFLKPHARPMAYLGGLAVYLGWVAASLAYLPGDPAGRQWTLGLCLAGGVVLAVGLADDLLLLPPAAKILGQALAATVLLAFDIGTGVVPNALAIFSISCPAWLGYLLSCALAMLLVVGACNATNLLDGMDGLCSGVTGIISLMFLVLAAHLAMYGHSPQYDPVRIVATLAMAGAVAGFLPYNFSPATIFLGDAGSMLLGLFAAAMILMFGERGIIRWVLGSILIFGLPILDTSLALLRRLRLRRSIFAGDRSHLYDQLVDRGFAVKQTVAIMYALSAFYGVTGLLIIRVRTRYAVPIYLVVAAITFYLCHRWGFLKPPVETPREQQEAADGQSGQSGQANT